MPETTTTKQSDNNDWAATMTEQTLSPQDKPESTTTPTDNNINTETGTETEAETETKNNTMPNAQTASVFEEFSKDKLLTNAQNDIDMILDIPVQLTVELGRTKITIKNLLQLAQGSVIELEGTAGGPMDVLVNGCLIAQGEVVVVNDKFGIRLTNIITPSERIRKLNH